MGLLASMGPGCFYPGNRLNGSPHRGYIPASMGPGCFYPGNSHSLFYSVFKDLRACARAPLHLKPNFHSRTIRHAANSRRPAALPVRERSPLHQPRPAARTRLPRRKHRVPRAAITRSPRPAAGPRLTKSTWSSVWWMIDASAARHRARSVAVNWHSKTENCKWSPNPRIVWKTLRRRLSSQMS